MSPLTAWRHGWRAGHKAAAPPKPKRRLLGLLPPKKAKERIALISTGKPVHLRLIQNIYWGGGAMLFGAAVVAGLYFNWLQVPWHLDISQLHIHVLWWYKKLAWDNWNPMPWLGQWTLFRHGYRNSGEPAVATMAVLIATAAGGAMVGKQMSKFRIISGPIILLILAFVLITSVVWLQFYGFPHLWHAMGWGRIYFNPTIAKAWGVLETFLLGFVVGHGLKFYWKPIAGHLQGVLMDRSVDKFWAKHADANVLTKTGPIWGVDQSALRFPFWIRFPVAPPTMRETWSKIVADDLESGEAVEIIRSGNGHTKVKSKTARRVQRTAITVGFAYAVYLAITGLMAQRWIALGHSVPYFTDHVQAATYTKVHLHAILHAAVHSIRR